MGICPCELQVVDTFFLAFHPFSVNLSPARIPLLSPYARSGEVFDVDIEKGLAAVKVDLL